MTPSEAYKILEVSEDIDDEELKKIYKKLALKYHPDRNKSEPEKFAQINSAYQLIQDYRANPQKYQENFNPFGQSGFQHINLNDIFQNFTGQSRPSVRRNQSPVQPIQIGITVSFKESVLGTKKDIVFNKTIKCSSCEGNGSQTIGNGCNSCNGFGKITNQNGNMIYTTSCSKCYGRNVRFQDCKDCSGKGGIERETHISLQVPPGNNRILRLQGVGNYAGSNFIGDAYTDVYVNVNIEKDPDMTFDGTDVISHISISLLDAIKGSEKQVRTIFDTRTISIPENSKNADQIKIPGCGNKDANGVHKVILDVQYNDRYRDDLIKFLERKEKN